MSDQGLSLTLRAISRQLAAVPCTCYLIRLVHQNSRKAFPGERLWTASQLHGQPIVRFLRARNRAGYDVYFRPYARRQNAGYILLDLDHAESAVLDTMRAHGHEPCVVLQTSPGHLQAWIRVSQQALPPAVANQIGKQLALLYQADPASTDWCHLGRLAGFTNQKPQRQLPGGRPPWVQVQQAGTHLASNGGSLVEAASHRLVQATVRHAVPLPGCAPALCQNPIPQTLTRHRAVTVYQTWMHRLAVISRFPDPDWSIVDLWIARALLRQGTSVAAVKETLRLASPHFPRRHADPEDYLRRTVLRAAAVPFPARH
jgi:hypothetical protein